MPELLIMRHAKSSWKKPDLDDHDRPLNARGQRDAPRMARFLASCGLVPNLALSSTARRAESTARLVLGVIDGGIDLELNHALYLAAPARWIESVRAAGGDRDVIILFGHNPGLEELVHLLTGEDEVMPTAAVAHVRISGAWADLTGKASHTLLDLWRPKELAGR